MQMQTQTETVTPAIAQNWLKRNRDNRVLRPHHITMMATAMRRGDFPLTHQAIAFDESGELLDGQNRLHAVVESGATVQFQVTRNAPRATFPYLDHHATRNTADSLKLDKKTSEVVNLLCAILLGRKGTPAQLQTISDAIASRSVILNGACNRNTPTLSSSSMRLAAITAMEMGEDPEYVMDLYRNLVLTNLHDLPAIGKSVISQVMRKAINATNKADMIARGMKLFRKSNANITKLQVMDQAVELDTVRTFYRGRIPSIFA